MQGKFAWGNDPEWDVSRGRSKDATSEKQEGEEEWRTAIAPDGRTYYWCKIVLFGRRAT
jgi:hypothetical protein